MKGKGKSTQSNTANNSESLKECPLSFECFELVDVRTVAPLYTEVTNREGTDAIRPTEIDTLQLELELLLVSVQQRLDTLREQADLLSAWIDKKLPINGNKLDSSSVGPSPAKKAKMAPEKPSKKSKDGPGPTTPVSNSRVSKGKLASAGKPSKGKASLTKAQPIVVEPVESPGAVSANVPRSEIPDKFWQSLEPYCADISSDDIHFLENLIKSHENNDQYFQTPQLGKHYTSKWAEEDLADERKESARVNEKSPKSAHPPMNGETQLLAKARNGIHKHNSTPYGPLTERLVASLLEENLLLPPDIGSLDDDDEPDVSSFDNISVESLSRQLNMGNKLGLEKRLKHELREQGLLDDRDNDTKLALKEENRQEESCLSSEDEVDDEILVELKRKQAELRTVCAHNLRVERKLLEAAKKDIIRVEKKRKLAVFDQEATEQLKRIQAARINKKPLSKKEKDKVSKLLQERSLLAKEVDQLESELAWN